MPASASRLRAKQASLALRYSVSAGENTRGVRSCDVVSVVAYASHTGVTRTSAQALYTAL